MAYGSGQLGAQLESGLGQNIANLLTTTGASQADLQQAIAELGLSEGLTQADIMSGALATQLESIIQRKQQKRASGAASKQRGADLAGAALQAAGTASTG